MTTREDLGLIDPPQYADYPDPTVTPKKPKSLYCGSGAKQTIVFDNYETEKVALGCANGGGQKAEVGGRFWDVEKDKSKLRSRMEAKGLIFEPIGREYLDTPMIYLISRKAPK